MSYILDALKKAERERNIQKVPTLMAEHEPAARTRKNRWLVFGTLLVCLGVLFWFAFFLKGIVDHPAPQLTTGQNGRGEGEIDRPAASIAPVTKMETSGERTASTAPPVVTGTGLPGSPGLPALKITDSERLQQLASSNQRPDDALEFSAQREAEERQPLARISPVIETKPEAPSPLSSRKGPLSVKEALNDMTLSILLYDENKADRMVFINGRKYVEGDMVEDFYFLDSITLQGAYLTYRGERALLRPKAK